MTAGNMTGFMGNHAGKLFRCLCEKQQTCVEKLIHAFGNESIDDVAVNNDNGHAPRIDVRSAVNGCGKTVQIVFDFCIADKGRLAATACLLCINGKDKTLCQDKDNSRYPARSPEPG